MAQMKMKAWYNRKARKRSCNEVLILLPLRGQPLQALYSRLYTIDKKVNEVDYIVTTPDRQKEKRLCHIIMLKLYQTRQGEVPRKTVCTVATEAGEESIEASPKLMNSQILQNLTPKLEHLPPSKQKDVEELMLTFY